MDDRLALILSIIIAISSIAVNFLPTFKTRDDSDEDLTESMRD